MRLKVALALTVASACLLGTAVAGAVKIEGGYDKFEKAKPARNGIVFAVTSTVTETGTLTITGPGIVEASTTVRPGTTTLLVRLNKKGKATRRHKGRVHFVEVIKRTTTRGEARGSVKF